MQKSGCWMLAEAHCSFSIEAMLHLYLTARMTSSCCKAHIGAIGSTFCDGVGITPRPCLPRKAIPWCLESRSYGHASAASREERRARLVDMVHTAAHISSLLSIMCLMEVSKGPVAVCVVHGEDSNEGFPRSRGSRIQFHGSLDKLVDEM